MADHTLPLSGGWILVTRAPPTVIRVKPLSVFYAMPDKVFVRDSFTDPWVPGRHLSRSQLMSVYRVRNNSKTVMPHEREEVKALEREFKFTNEFSLQLEQRVRIETPDGTLCLEPYEWNSLEDISPYLDSVGEGYTLREYGETTRVSSQIESQIFYMQSRGLPKSSALSMIARGSGGKSSKLMWLEPDQELVDYFFRRTA